MGDLRHSIVVQESHVRCPNICACVCLVVFLCEKLFVFVCGKGKGRRQNRRASYCQLCVCVRVCV